MSRSFLRRTAAILTLTIGLAACAADDETTTDAPVEVESPADDAADTDDAGDETADEDATDGADAEVAGDAATFPVTVTDSTGDVTIEEQPTAIISLSPTSTEMLFALGAGEQVVAVDDFSNFPPEAPTTDLSGFNPNVEAVLGYEPDLVIIQNDSNDLVAGLTEAGVTVLQFDAANDFQAAFDQMEALGAATGNDAEAIVAEIQADLDAAAADAGVDAGLTYYHELSADLFSATSATFIGEVYGMFGMENIADAADSDATGYPQLSKEYVVEQDPDYVFLACTIFCGETAESFCAREGFEALTACAEGNVVELDDDAASRWGPRMVGFAETVAGALSDG